MIRKAAWVGLMVAGCEPPADPADAYRAFAAALQRGDVAACWNGLSSSAQRRALDQVTQARAPVAVGEAEAMNLVCGEARVLVPRIQSVRVEQADGDRARLIVTTDQATTYPATVVREGAAWRLDLGEPPATPAR